MTVLDQTRLRYTMRAQLRLGAGLGTIPISFEGEPFDPPKQDLPTPWVHERLATTLEDRPATAMNRSLGTVIYTVHYPDGKGTEVPESLSKAIAEVLEHAQTLQDAGSSLEVNLVRTERLPRTTGVSPFDSGGGIWQMYSVRIEWRVFTATTVGTT